MGSRTILLNSNIFGTVTCNNKVSLSQLFLTPTVITTDHIISTSEYLIYVDTNDAIGSVTITLPLANTVNNQTFFIVDGTGAANVKPIKIVSSGGDLICGQTSILVTTSYTSLTLFAYGPKNIYSII